MEPTSSPPSSSMGNFVSGGFPPTGRSPRISPTGFTVGIFTLLGISILTIIARVILRLQRSKRLQIDDYFLLAALILLCAAAGLQQYFRELNYLILNVELGNIPPDQTFIEGSPLEAKILDASSVLLWASIFCVKFSFLAFFWNLVQRVRLMKTCWWIVMGFVFPSAMVCTFLGFIECPYFGPNFIEHCPAQILIEKEHIYLNVTVVLDIFTDILIIALPVTLLWNVKIAWAKKITLLGMFGLSTVMIIIALIRVTMAPLTDMIIDTTWLFFWQVMEASIAILMVSVSAFRGLFGQAASARSAAYGSGKDRAVAGKSSGKSSDSEGSTLKGSTPRNIRGMISSPRSPKILSSFTPMRTEPDVEIAKGGKIITSSIISSSFNDNAIEMGKVIPSSAYSSRSPSRAREISPTRDGTHKRLTTLAGRSKELPPAPTQAYSLGTGVSATAWSDNDQRSKSNRSSRWDMAKITWNEHVHGQTDGRDSSASRNTSRGRELDRRPTDKTTSSRDASAHVSRVPSVGEQLIRDKEQESARAAVRDRSYADDRPKDHDRSRNGSNSTATAAQGHGKISIEEWI